VTINNVIGKNLKASGITAPTAPPYAAPKTTANPAMSVLPTAHLINLGRSAFVLKKNGKTITIAKVSPSKKPSNLNEVNDLPNSNAKKKSTNVVSMAKPLLSKVAAAAAECIRFIDCS